MPNERNFDHCWWATSRLALKFLLLSMLMPNCAMAGTPGFALLADFELGTLQQVARYIFPVQGSVAHAI